MSSISRCSVNLIEVYWFPPFTGDNPDPMVDDPTSTGKITARTAHVLAQVRDRFPSASWVCWSPRPRRHHRRALRPPALHRLPLMSLAMSGYPLLVATSIGVAPSSFGVVGSDPWSRR